MPKLATEWFLAPAVAVLAVCAAVSPSEAAWLIYHKPAFKGQVLDAESQRPLQGVAVDVIYHKTIFGLAGSGPEPFHVRETATDNNGMFHVPAYTTVTNPFSTSSFALIVFFTPGYSGLYLIGRFDRDVGTYAEDCERFFSENFGKEDDMRLDLTPGKIGSRDEWRKVVFGIIRLPRLKTMEERREAIPMSLHEEFRKDTPLLNRLIDEEYEYLGIR